RFFDDAHQAGVSVLISADGTDTVFGHVEANFAEPDLGFDVGNRIGQRNHVGFGCFEDMKGDALGRFGADTREPAELIDKTWTAPSYTLVPFFRYGLKFW